MSLDGFRIDLPIPRPSNTDPLDAKGTAASPYNKVTGYLCVPKDLANHLTDIVLLYRVASHWLR